MPRDYWTTWSRFFLDGALFALLQRRSARWKLRSTQALLFCAASALRGGTYSQGIVGSVVMAMRMVSLMRPRLDTGIGQENCTAANVTAWLRHTLYLGGLRMIR